VAYQDGKEAREEMSASYYINHLSASQVDQFSRCGIQWYKRYIDGLKIPPGIAALTGSSAHEAFELNFKSKLTTGEDLPLSDLEDCAATAYREKLDRQGVFIARENLPSAQADLSDGRDMAVAICKPFKEDFAHTIQPAMVEEKMTLDVEGLPTIVGYLDLYTSDGRLSDSKTTKRKWPQNDVDTATQPTLYREMIKAKTGSYPRVMTIDQFIKTKEPRFESTETIRTSDDFRILTDRFKVMLKMVQAGIFLPAQPGAWNCSAKWCGFFAGCAAIPEHRKLLPKRSE
jgi:hypothetical protein